MSDTLEQVLEEVRSDCVVLRKYGYQVQADVLETLIARIQAAATSYVSWLPEAEAVERSGRARRWLRSRFASWERSGCARRTGSAREYMQAVIPSRDALRLLSPSVSEVYVVLRREAALVKIGVSTNVEQRISDFKRASGGGLELLLRIAGTRIDEQELHRRFAEYRKQGEWFSYSDELKAWVAEQRHAQKASA